ncbi:unnamed protein product [Paramecium sonneborni]|uniref:Uncharacterized protein n=1 Tax=Paramecium sonneborni TaxID=65129 RepID=A0A8S1NC07_9CILI|nr:unnamed protein product [Paramecium sonneborni]
MQCIDLLNIRHLKKYYWILKLILGCQGQSYFIQLFQTTQELLHGSFPFDYKDQQKLIKISYKSINNFSKKLHQRIFHLYSFNYQHPKTSAHRVFEIYPSQVFVIQLFTIKDKSQFHPKIDDQLEYQYCHFNRGTEPPPKIVIDTWQSLPNRSPQQGDQIRSYNFNYSQVQNHDQICFVKMIFFILLLQKQINQVMISLIQCKYILCRDFYIVKINRSCIRTFHSNFIQFFTS